MLANNSATNAGPKQGDTGKTEAAVLTPAQPNAPAPSSAGTPSQPKRSIGVKEVIPFAWKLLGDACDGMTMTLFKAVEREEVEAHFERTTRDGHYDNLRIVKADEKIVQPKVKNPLHYINTPKPVPSEKKVVKTKKTKITAPTVVKVKRKKVKDKVAAKTVKKAAAKKKKKKATKTTKVKKKVAVKKKKTTKKAVTKKTPSKKKAAVKKKAPAKKKASTKKKTAKKKKKKK